MRQYIKIFFLIALLYNNQLASAQRLSLKEITSKADHLIEESKDRQALSILEQVKIEDYADEDNLRLASFYFVKATAYDFNEEPKKSIQSFLMACDYYEKSGVYFGPYLQSLQSIGRLFYHQGELELAEKHFKKVIVSGTPSLILNNNQEQESLSCAFYYLGIIYTDKDNIDFAEECLGKIKLIGNKNDLYHSLYNYINKKSLKK